MSLVDTNWLKENIDNVKIIDCSWHMPQTQRNGFEEYNKDHIPNAIFFDLDKNSKLDTDLPHMLTDSKSWGKIMSNMGISNNDRIVIYDNSDVISSCRCWYNLIYYGHDPKLVHVLNGGLKKWKKENKITNNKEVITKTSVYLCKDNKEHFNYIFSYAPYNNIKKMDYPHILITTSLSDNRVLFDEPAKFTAKLRDYKTDNNLLLLKTEMNAGHGGKSGRDGAIEEIAIDYAFALKISEKI